MDPVVALQEIATLLEREGASKFRSSAFRTAARAFADAAADTRVMRVRHGHIPGIGSSSRTVILQALDGAVPEYLQQLRERAGVPESALRPLLRGDLHTHSDWSDGTTSIDAMVAAARTLGHAYMALTDHSPRLRVARGLSPERLREQLSVVAEFRSDDFTLLSGCEVDILADGTLDHAPSVLAELDVVVASVHSKLPMDSAPMTRRMVAAISSGQVDVLGHVTGRLIAGDRGTRPGSAFDAEAVFRACAEHEVAVEINARPERCDPPDPLLRLATDLGCLFSIDSDAHAPGELAWIADGAARAEALGVPPERIVTTWPLARLREWLARGSR